MASPQALPFSEVLWLSRGSSYYYDDSHRRLQQEIREYVQTEWHRFVQSGNDRPLFPERIRRSDFCQIILKGRTRFGLEVTESDGKDPFAIQSWFMGVQRFLNSPRSRIRRCWHRHNPKRSGEVYNVNGAMKWITNGLFADYGMAAVRTGGKGAAEISALIQDSGVYVPVTGTLSKENEGFPIIMHNCNPERLWLACTALRLARICAEDAYRHAIAPKTFGSRLSRTRLSGQNLQIWASSYLYVAGRERNGTGADLGLGGLFADPKVLASRTLENVNKKKPAGIEGAGLFQAGLRRKD
ncbi:hypothetical protein BDW66DRAFT_159163 [Aspergillus desertorum]